MLSKDGQFFYNLLKIPFEYQINKEILKKNYYKISMETHPDITHENSFNSLNKAFSILKDDFERAKLFTKPVETLESKFLEKCIKLEEKIIKGEDLTEKLNKKIEKCKSKFDDSVSVGKWAYFKRLLEKI